MNKFIDTDTEQNQSNTNLSKLVKLIEHVQN